jgi:CheY-like chemotaxis protein
MRREIEKIVAPLIQIRLPQRDIVNKKGNTSAGTGRKRILVVDDDNGILTVLLYLLREMDFDVEAAENGYEAKELFLSGAFDLVMTDLQMPGMDGWELAFNIKRMSPGTPVILITGAEKDMVEGGKNFHHVDSVLFKPFKLEIFKDTVYGLVGNHSTSTST